VVVVVALYGLRRLGRRGFVLIGFSFSF